MLCGDVPWEGSSRRSVSLQGSLSRGSSTCVPRGQGSAELLERDRGLSRCAFRGFGDGVRKILRQAADQLSNKLSHAQHLDEVTWTTKNWHGLQMQRLSVVLHTAVAWQTVNELACGESGIVHGAECIAVLNGVA